MSRLIVLNSQLIPKWSQSTRPDLRALLDWRLTYGRLHRVIRANIEASKPRLSPWVVIERGLNSQPATREFPFRRASCLNAPNCYLFLPHNFFLWTKWWPGSAFKQRFLVINQTVKSRARCHLALVTIPTAAVSCCEKTHKTVLSHAATTFVALNIDVHQLCSAR